MKMPSIKSILSTLVVGLVTFTSAAPGLPKISERSAALITRQNAAEAALGLTDVDILIFALTLEFLEFTFYQTGFAMFPDSDFTALGLSADELTDLKSLVLKEGDHVAFLLSAIAQTGTEPVKPCTYDFGFTTAAEMVAIALQLEHVGMSAYLGGAALISSPSILEAAAQILTTESRHETFVRIALKLDSAPNSFDTPLDPISVFTIASQFIKECPEGSNLQLKPFNKLTASNAQGIQPFQNLQISSDTQGATHCAWTSGGASSGGVVFTPLNGNSCLVPGDVLAGIVYVHLVTPAQTSVDSGKIVTSDVKAGVLLIQID